MLLGARLGLVEGTRVSPNSNSCLLMSALNLSYKVMIVELMHELGGLSK